MIKSEILQWYRQQAKRTLPDLGSPRENYLHMFSGIITEYGELVDPYKKAHAYGKTIDLVNVAEEWADGMWYFANMSNMFPEILGHYTFDSIDGWIALNKCLTSIANKEKPLLDLVIRIESICESHKIRDFTYAFAEWILLGKLLDIDMEKALVNNIDKLKKRYPEKFDQDKAINRDLEAERRELEK